jgi:hypothetical protein
MLNSFKSKAPEQDTARASFATTRARGLHAPPFNVASSTRLLRLRACEDFIATHSRINRLP